jgi:hypothetical protein
MCAADEAGTLKGIAWPCVGVQRKSWCTVDDVSVTPSTPGCNGAEITELHQGALNIAGLGLPAVASNLDALARFRGYTSQSLLSLISTPLEDSPPRVRISTSAENGYLTSRTYMVQTSLELMGAGVSGLVNLNGGNDLVEICLDLFQHLFRMDT